MLPIIFLMMFLSGVAQKKKLLNVLKRFLRVLKNVAYRQTNQSACFLLKSLSTVILLV